DEIVKIVKNTDTEDATTQDKIVRSIAESFPTNKSGSRSNAVNTPKYVYVFPSRTNASAPIATGSTSNCPCNRCNSTLLNVSPIYTGLKRLRQLKRASVIKTQ